jgi:hypothetical protein
LNTGIAYGPKLSSLSITMNPADDRVTLEVESSFPEIAAINV